MKKILFGIFLVMIPLTFFILLEFESERINKTIFSAGESSSITIQISKEVNLEDRVKVIDTLKRVSEKYKPNLIYKVYHNAPGQKLNLTKYVYLKDSAAFFSEISYQGRCLSDFDSSNGFLSTSDTDDREQIAWIHSLDENTIFKITSIENLKNTKNTLAGFYSVKVDKNQEDLYMQELNDLLEVKVDKVQGMNAARVFIAPVFKIIPLAIITLLAVLVVLFDLIVQFKEIGIKKLHGYSADLIKREYLLKVLAIGLSAAMFGYIALVMIYFGGLNILFAELFVKSFLITGSSIILISLILLIPLTLIDRFTISSAIKNRRPVEAVGNTGNFFKFMFTAVLLGLFLSGVRMYVPVSNFYLNNVRQWEDTVQYAQVPLQYEEQDRSVSSMVWEGVQMKRLYLYANEQGGLKIQVHGYEHSQNPDPIQRETENILLNTITVNNNYLKRNPIYDLNGNRITVNEDENIIRLLIPVKLAHLQEQAISFFEQNYYSAQGVPLEVQTLRLKEIEALHKAAPEIFDKEASTFEVILVQDDQSYFTYNIELYPESNNRVTDRIAVVANNRADMFSGISDFEGFFIKTDDMEDPFMSIQVKVSELGLQAYYSNAYSAYSSVADYIGQYLRVLGEIAVIFIVSGLTITILIGFSAMIYMEKEKMDKSVKLLNGYGFFVRNGRKLLAVFCFYFLYIPGFFILKGNTAEMKYLAAFLGGVALFDVLVSGVVIMIYEKKNIKDVLKGN